MPNKLSIEDVLAERLKQLQEMSFGEIEELPAYQVKTIDKGRKPLILSVWKDTVDGNEIRIVVQAYRYWFLGFGRMSALGFVIDHSGRVRQLRQDELYEFS